jgi:acetolactate synthase-1/2/3 large subunit
LLNASKLRESNISSVSLAKRIWISSDDELLPVLKDALNQKVPAIVDCPVDYSENLRLTEKLGRLICPL